MNPEDETLGAASEFEQTEKTLTETLATKDELAFLATADVDDPKVQEWMQKNGVQYGESVVVHVDGLQDIVMITDKDDFGTRDKAATEKWRESVLTQFSGSEASPADDTFEASVSASRSVVEAIDAEVDRHSAEIAEQEPRVSAETAREIGEEGLDASGVTDPTEEASSSLESLMSGASSGPLKFDIDAASKKIEQEDAERIIPQEELSRVQGAVSEILRQYTIKYDNPGAEAEAFDSYQMPHNLVGEANSVLTRLEKGYMGKEAASLELGMLIAGVKDPHAAEAMAQRLEASKQFSDEEVTALNEQIVNVVKNAGYQGREGDHFRGILMNFHDAADNTFREGTKIDAVKLAMIGASIGVYARLGDVSALHAGMSRLSTVTAELYKIKK